ncbi:MAG: hypothetical protein HYY32_04100 [Chloroflexi bacterium]|nr:hypothetical protein [Chloroflexota bacterium]
MSQEGSYEVVWPRGRQAAGPVSYARRLETLAGKTIGELWDWSFYGESVFPEVEKELGRRYPGIKFVGYDRFGSTLGAKEGEVLDALPARLKEHGCDAVISGMGC